MPETRLQRLSMIPIKKEISSNSTNPMKDNVFSNLNSLICTVDTNICELQTRRREYFQPEQIEPEMLKSNKM